MVLMQQARNVLRREFGFGNPIEFRIDGEMVSGTKIGALQCRLFKQGAAQVAFIEDGVGQIGFYKFRFEQFAIPEWRILQFQSVK